MTTNVYRIDGPTPGRLAIMPRPRGGDWLEDEVLAWRKLGFKVVASLLTPDELADLDLSLEEELCRTHRVQFFSFPILDRGIPESRDAFAGFVANLAKHYADGTTIAVHCRQGIGRAALVAICVLVRLDFDPEAAIQRVSAARGCPVPETPEQRQWVVDFARRLFPIT